MGEYLVTTLSNSMVIGVYQGRPHWHHFDDVTSLRKDVDVSVLSKQEKSALGFLSMTGNEKLFPIDGQHRLAGIKQVVEEGLYNEDERLSVIFVAHDNSNIEKSRRLFTTLNKTAKPVGKHEIIALDEDDLMAIIVRRLVETHSFFKGNRISYKGQASKVVGDKSLINITTLYDLLTELFKNVKKSPNFEKAYRPSDEAIDEYHKFSISYFELLSKSFPEIEEYFHAKNYGQIVEQCRTNAGGHVLFRPVGLMAFTRAFSIVYNKLTDDPAVSVTSLKKCFKLMSKLPVSIEEEPYVNIIWDEEKSAPMPKGKALASEIMAYLLDCCSDEQKLTRRYADFFNKDAAQVSLPSKII